MERPADTDDPHASEAMEVEGDFGAVRDKFAKRKPHCFPPRSGLEGLTIRLPRTVEIGRAQIECESARCCNPDGISRFRRLRRRSASGPLAGLQAASEELLTPILQRCLTPSMPPAAYDPRRLGRGSHEQWALGSALADDQGGSVADLPQDSNFSPDCGSPQLRRHSTDF